MTKNNLVCLTVDEFYRMVCNARKQAIEIYVDNGFSVTYIFEDNSRTIVSSRNYYAWVGQYKVYA